MALSPTSIPTSFVPKQPVGAPTKYAKSGGNPFMLIAVILLTLSLVASAGVFAYERYLTSIRDTKAQEVKIAQEETSGNSVQEFIRTRNRFTSGKEILDSHIAASQFLDVLERMTLQNVRFDSLTFTMLPGEEANVTMEGTARSFNALAAQSAALATDKRIRRAIFSEISTNAVGNVSFSLSAELDAELVTFVAPAAVPVDVPEVPPVATTTPATTSPVSL